MEEILDKFIGEANELIQLAPSSPRQALWRNRVEKFLQENYDENYLNIWKRTIRNSIIAHSSGQVLKHFQDRMRNAIELLVNLKNEPKLDVGNSKKQTEDSAGLLQSLHPIISDKCSKLYNDESYAEAVEKSFKVVRDRLRELTTYETGSDAFGKGGLFIRGASSTNTEEDFNKGVKFLTMAIDCFRNEKAHTSDGNISDSIRAYEYLRVSSLAMSLLESTDIKKK